MANIPSVANINATRIHFDSDDRVLVRVNQATTPEQRNRIRETVHKWCHLPVANILVYDITVMDISVESGGVVHAKEIVR
jgi:hypothetical protein